MRGTFVALALLAAGCASSEDEAALAPCERGIEARLASPSTVEYVDVQFSADREDGSRGVLVDFDAANAFGTPVRRTAHCFVRDTADGQWALDSLDLR